MKARQFFVIFAGIAAVTLAAMGTSWALDPAELQAFLDVGMTDEVKAMCAQNAAEVASSPQLQSVCAKVGGGGAMPSSPAAPPASIPEAPAIPETPAMPETPSMASTPSAPAMPSAPSGFSSTPTAPAAPAAASMTQPADTPSGPPAYVAIDATAGVTAETFISLNSAKQFQQCYDLCREKDSMIRTHPERREIRKACVEAGLKLYADTPITGEKLALAIEDLKKVNKDRRTHSSTYQLGKSQILTLDQMTSDTEKLDEEKNAVRNMWDAIIMRHAEEDFKEAVSDMIILWTIGNSMDEPGFVNLVTDRIFKNETNKGRVRWLSARLRMLSDRFVEIDPNKGENEIRESNLEILRVWMTELQNLTYFDNNSLVGMYKYKGNRLQEQYAATAETEAKFHQGLWYYNQGRSRAQSHKAKASLDQSIAYLCSRYRSEGKDKLVAFYRKGFQHARRGLKLMKVVNRVQPELGKKFYRHEEDNTELTSQLQKSYGVNLTGYIYNLYLLENYKGVIALKRVALDAGFDWESKADVLILFAESAQKMASESLDSELNYRKYKEMTLAAGNRAFKFALRRRGGKAPTAYDEDFCRVFNAYWNYLDGFGQTVQAKALDNRFSHVCPMGGGAPPAGATE